MEDSPSVFCTDRFIAKLESQANAPFRFTLGQKTRKRHSLTGILLLPEMLGVGTAGNGLYDMLMFGGTFIEKVLSSKRQSWTLEDK